MKSRLGMVVWALAAGMMLRAAEPSSAPATGRILVLDNERILEGEIERVGQQYRLRRGQGESWVPAEKALCLCANQEEAFRFLRGRANLRDPDERLRLARWCYLHGLREQGLAEAQAFLDMRPQSAEGRHLLRNMQRSSAATAPPAQSVETPRSNPPNVELPSETLDLFTRRVQPILMNACARCHVAGRGGAFQLIRSSGPGGHQSRVTQQNLAAAFAQIKTEQWPASPLLLKALSDHGSAGQPPLQGRQSPAYRSLEEWVKMAAGSQESMVRSQESGVRSQEPVVRSQESGARSQGSRAKSQEPRVKSQEPESRRREEGVSRKETEGSRKEEECSRKKAEFGEGGEGLKEAPPQEGFTSSESAVPLDPFDPVLFNRQMHPERYPAIEK